MQNRYFADVGDYGKYGLLRKLTGITSNTGPMLSLGVAWYLVPDEGHNDDGKHISYLKKQEYRRCDPELFDGLNHLLADGIREVSKIQSSTLLPKSTIYFDGKLTHGGMPILGPENRAKRLAVRSAWIKNSYNAIKNQDIIFLDPDNGFEIKSVKRHADKAPKYVFWDEVTQFLTSNKTLVIYHHLNRTMTSADQIAIKVQEFQDNLPEHPNVTPILFKRGSHRVFFVIHSKQHLATTVARIEELRKSAWAPHLDVFS